MSKAGIATFLLMWNTLPSATVGQVASFSNVNTSNGLSDNYTQSLAIDSSGFLWIGTSDGLNVYDGHAISTWYTSSGTGLPSDTIRHLYFDSHNRLWATSPGSVAFADHDRIFQPVILSDSIAKYSCYALFETNRYGIVIFTRSGNFSFEADCQQWKKIDWLSELISPQGFNAAVKISGDQGVFVYEEKIILIDFKRQLVSYEQAITQAVAACRYDDYSIAVATRHGHVVLLDHVVHKELRSFDIFNDTGGNKSSPVITGIVKAADGSLVLATSHTGLAVIDIISRAITYHRHDPLRSNSISSNTIYRLCASQNGDVIAGAQISGVSIFNIHSKKAEYKRIFIDPKGNIFDGHSNGFAEDSKGNFWIAASDRLICWNKESNQSQFYSYFFNDPDLGPHHLQIRTILIDRQGIFWVSAIGAGVVIFDPVTGKFKQFNRDTSARIEVRQTYVNEIVEDSNGNIWIGNYAGMFRINGKDHQIETFEDHPLLKTFVGKVIISIYETRQHKLWIGTQRFGIYCYDPAAQTLVNFTTENGLLGNTGLSIVEDHEGNIYTAHNQGFSQVSTYGEIHTFSKSNGMRFPRCESILVDDQGYVWIANNKCLARYSPKEHHLDYFDINSGISADGFRFDAAFKSTNGIFLFGTQQGIQYFDPAILAGKGSQLRVTNYMIALQDTIFRFDHSPDIKLGPADNNIQFYFTAINLSGSRNITYQYMLDGYDTGWQSGTDIPFARYASLPPGVYTFKVRAGVDQTHWTEANNDVRLTIIPPFWERAWFIAASVMILSGLVFAAFQFRINRIRDEERLKTKYNKQMAETEMKALQAQMNPHFIFNSLNSINKYILKSDQATASRYLTRFAKLIRLILNHSNSKEVALSDELEALRLYIEMELLRFSHKFIFTLQVAADVNVDLVQVPPLLIQPYVENAIWHGLMQKEGEGMLNIYVQTAENNLLKCIIEDNGIGRAKAGELKAKTAAGKRSLGMKLTEERISRLNLDTLRHATVEVIDLVNEAGEASGTKVILTIPIQL